MFTTWYKVWQLHIINMRRYPQDAELYSKAAAIAQMEYVTNLAIAMVAR